MASLTDDPEAPRARPRIATRDLAGRYAIVGVLVAMVVAFSILRPETFATGDNLRAILTSQATMVVLAIAATLPLRAGDFDVSIAATMGLAGAVAAQLLLGGAPVVVAVLAAVAVGALVGAINATLVVIVGIDAFVATLATMTGIGGLTYAVTKSEVLTGFPSGLSDLVTAEIGGLPLSVLIGWLLVGGLWFLYERTPAGRYLLFVGGGRDAARLAGVPVRRVRALAFVGSGVLSALAGVLLIGALGAMDPSVGPQYLLQPFAAAFLGATALQIGRFNALGTLIAVYLLAVGITGLQMMGAEFWVADVFNGVALVVAVVAARVLGPRARGSS